MMLTPVKILSFDVCFGVHKDIEMMPTFLRCFPNVEVLHIKSADCDDPTGNLNLRFWEDQAGPIISVMFHIKVMTFSEFRGKQYELSFLQCFFESARFLKYAVIIMANPGFTSLSVYEMLSSVQNMSDEKWASKFYLAVRGSNGEGSRLWNFEQGADFSDEILFHQLKSSQPRRPGSRGCRLASVATEVFDTRPIGAGIRCFESSPKYLMDFCGSVARFCNGF
uniref:Uncharacterized protein n=2 Tax=Avena sativa TaxID=4498 RepID=A0ACD5W7F5_AVESA